MSAPLSIYGTISQTRALGPFLRFAVWVQGCPFRCRNCMTPDALPEMGGYSVPMTELAHQIIDTPDIEGLTLSGGEPFAQSHGLARLINQVRKQKDIGVIAYSGYTLLKLRQTAEKEPSVNNLLGAIDLLIDGPYISARNDGLSLRGSSNQRVHALTERYAAIIGDWYARPRREVKMHLRRHDLMLVGIPGKTTLQDWQVLKMKSREESIS